MKDKSQLEKDKIWRNLMDAHSLKVLPKQESTLKKLSTNWFAKSEEICKDPTQRKEKMPKARRKEEDATFCKKNFCLL